MSILNLRYEKNYERLCKNIFIRLIVTILISIGASLFIWITFWSINNHLTHLMLGLINIFILVAIFLFSWNISENKKSFNILCPGFFIVAILDFIHSYRYIHSLQSIRLDESSISLAYWVSARILEFGVLLAYLYRPRLLRRHKNAISVILTIFAGFLIYIINITKIQYFYGQYAVINLKIMLSFISIIGTIFILSKMKNNFRRNIVLESKYFGLSIVFVIMSELFSVFLEGFSSFWIVFVTILRTCSYFYLYKGIFEDFIKSSNYMLDKRAYTARSNKHLLLNSPIKKETLLLGEKSTKDLEVKNLSLNVEEILNAVSVPTIIVDYKGKIVVCSESYANLVDIPYGDIISTSISDLIKNIILSNKDVPDCFNINDYENKVEDWLIETPKGNKKYVQVTFSIITDSYNDKIGMVCVMHDITRLKEEQKKLINQEKLALMGQMGATIVHETRNFLTTIKGNSQLIELYCDNEKIRKYAQKINYDTNEVNRIITEFLNLSKPRETELEEVSFSDLVLSMRNTIETSSLMSNAQLVMNIDYDERYVLCDETQIKQVILNICKNAVESMEKVSNPTLRISTGLDESHKEVFINISDNGTGIDKETIKKIGTPFFTTKKTGTGLGLNACYQIIKEHHGRIEIKSKLGEGTTFKIIIPYLDEDIEDEVI